MIADQLFLSLVSFAPKIGQVDSCQSQPAIPTGLSDEVPGAIIHRAGRSWIVGYCRNYNYRKKEIAGENHVELLAHSPGELHPPMAKAKCNQNVSAGVTVFFSTSVTVMVR